MLNMRIFAPKRILFLFRVAKYHATKCNAADFMVLAFGIIIDGGGSFLRPPSSGRDVVA